MLLSAFLLLVVGSANLCSCYTYSKRDAKHPSFYSEKGDYSVSLASIVTHPRVVKKRVTTRTRTTACYLFNEDIEEVLYPVLNKNVALAEKALKNSLSLLQADSVAALGVSFWVFSQMAKEKNAMSKQALTLKKAKKQSTARTRTRTPYESFFGKVFSQVRKANPLSNLVSPDIKVQITEQTVRNSLNSPIVPENYWFATVDTSRKVQKSQAGKVNTVDPSPVMVIPKDAVVPKPGETLTIDKSKTASKPPAAAITEATEDTVTSFTPDLSSFTKPDEKVTASTKKPTSSVLQTIVDLSPTANQTYVKSFQNDSAITSDRWQEIMAVATEIAKAVEEEKKTNVTTLSLSADTKQQEGRTENSAPSSSIESDLKRSALAPQTEAVDAEEKESTLSGMTKSDAKVMAAPSNQQEASLVKKETDVVKRAPTPAPIDQQIPNSVEERTKMRPSPETAMPETKVEVPINAAADELLQQNINETPIKDISELKNDTALLMVLLAMGNQTNATTSPGEEKQSAESASPLVVEPKDMMTSANNKMARSSLATREPQKAISSATPARKAAVYSEAPVGKDETPNISAKESGNVSNMDDADVFSASLTVVNQPRSTGNPTEKATGRPISSTTTELSSRQPSYNGSQKNISIEPTVVPEPATDRVIVTPPLSPPPHAAEVSWTKVPGSQSDTDAGPSTEPLAPRESTGSSQDDERDVSSTSKSFSSMAGSFNDAPENTVELPADESFFSIQGGAKRVSEHNVEVPTNTGSGQGIDSMPVDRKGTGGFEGSYLDTLSGGQTSAAKTTSYSPIKDEFAKTGNPGSSYLSNLSSGNSAAFNASSYHSEAESEKFDAAQTTMNAAEQPVAVEPSTPTFPPPVEDTEDFHSGNRGDGGSNVVLPPLVPRGNATDWREIDNADDRVALVPKTLSPMNLTMESDVDTLPSMQARQLLNTTNSYLNKNAIRQSDTRAAYEKSQTTAAPVHTQPVIADDHEKKTGYLPIISNEKVSKGQDHDPVRYPGAQTEIAGRVRGGMTRSANTQAGISYLEFLSGGRVTTTKRSSYAPTKPSVKESTADHVLGCSYLGFANPTSSHYSRVWPESGSAEKSKSYCVTSDEITRNEFSLPLSSTVSQTGSSYLENIGGGFGGPVRPSWYSPSKSGCFEMKDSSDSYVTWLKGRLKRSIPISLSPSSVDTRRDPDGSADDTKASQVHSHFSPAQAAAASNLSNSHHGIDTKPVVKKRKRNHDKNSWAPSSALSSDRELPVSEPACDSCNSGKFSLSSQFMDALRSGSKAPAKMPYAPTKGSYKKTDNYGNSYLAGLSGDTKSVDPEKAKTKDTGCTRIELAAEVTPAEDIEPDASSWSQPASGVDFTTISLPPGAYYNPGTFALNGHSYTDALHQGKKAPANKSVSYAPSGGSYKRTKGHGSSYLTGLSGSQSSSESHQPMERASSSGSPKTSVTASAATFGSAQGGEATEGPAIGAENVRHVPYRASPHNVIPTVSVASVHANNDESTKTPARAQSVRDGTPASNPASSVGFGDSYLDNIHVTNEDASRISSYAPSKYHFRNASGNGILYPSGLSGNASPSSHLGDDINSGRQTEKCGTSVARSKAAAIGMHNTKSTGRTKLPDSAGLSDKPKTTPISAIAVPVISDVASPVRAAEMSPKITDLISKSATATNIPIETTRPLLSVSTGHFFSHNALLPAFNKFGPWGLYVRIDRGSSRNVSKGMADTHRNEAKSDVSKLTEAALDKKSLLEAAKLFGSPLSVVGSKFAQKKDSSSPSFSSKQIRKMSKRKTCSAPIGLVARISKEHASNISNLDMGGVSSVNALLSDLNNHLTQE